VSEPSNNISTSNLDNKDLMLKWSIQLPTGSTISTYLPKTVRTFEEFIKVDQYTGDSDPVYWAITAARHKWGYQWASRFCVAMLAYYHTGVAVSAAQREGTDFWRYLNEIYTRAPRASERRHFRGAAGLIALRSMERFHPDPSTWFQGFRPTYAAVRGTCETQLKQFGPYFQLKICDYMDRCLTIPIQSWVGLAENLPGEPAVSLKEMNPPGGFTALVARAREVEIFASPLFDRLVGPAEVETALCGWHTTKFKGNWFGADILDKRKALEGYGDKAMEFQEMFPPVPPKDTFKVNLK